MGWDRMGWGGMGRDGLGWYGIEWDGTGRDWTDGAASTSIPDSTASASSATNSEASHIESPIDAVRALSAGAAAWLHSLLWDPVVAISAQAALQKKPLQVGQCGKSS